MVRASERVGKDEGIAVGVVLGIDVGAIVVGSFAKEYVGFRTGLIVVLGASVRV